MCVVNVAIVGLSIMPLNYFAVLRTVNSRVSSASREFKVVMSQLSTCWNVTLIVSVLIRIPLDP